MGKKTVDIKMDLEILAEFLKNDCIAIAEFAKDESVMCAKINDLTRFRLYSRMLWVFVNTLENEKERIHNLIGWQGYREKEYLTEQLGLCFGTLQTIGQMCDILVENCDFGGEEVIEVEEILSQITANLDREITLICEIDTWQK